jgi:hypothetical protein
MPYGKDPSTIRSKPLAAQAAMDWWKARTVASWRSSAAQRGCASGSRGNIRSASMCTTGKGSCDCNARARLVFPEDGPVKTMTLATRPIIIVAVH